MGQIDAQHWLDRLHSLKPWNGAGGFGIDSIRSVLEALGNPQDSFKTIHIAGTNGKGSTTAFISEILLQAGYKVGRLISPHLSRVNERVQVNRIDIADIDLALQIKTSLEAAAELDCELSFFETIICCGFLHCRESQVDYAVVEVGLGGRLDATNIISKPDCSIITTIGLDHQRLLGDTEAEIAGEKAGIIKSGVPVVIGQLGNEAETVVRRVSSELGSDLFCLGRDFTIQKVDDLNAILNSRYGELPLLPSLPGEHQYSNAALAAFTSKMLGVADNAIELGVANTSWPCRLEMLELNDRRFILDCAHNMQGIRAVTSFIQSEELKELTVIAGFLETKEWSGMLQQLIPFMKEFKVAEPDSNMAISADKIADVVNQESILTSVHYKDYAGLVRELMEEKYIGRDIVITGSIYLVGQLRGLLISSAAG